MSAFVRFDGSLNHFLEYLRDVLNFHGFAILKGQPAFLKMGDAIGAGSRQDLSPDPYSLFYSEVGESFTSGRFHPNPAAPAAAAKAVFQRIGHLNQF